MPVFKTERNRVIADDPEADDHWVQVVWHGPPKDAYDLLLDMKVIRP